MITKHAYLQGFSGLHTTGIYDSDRGYTNWEEGQAGPGNVKRTQVFDSPFPTFGKLQVADRLAFSATSLIFRTMQDYDGSDTGICLGTSFGSFSTDLRFMESIATGFPRPAYFSATLPSSPVAEVAISFKLKGPDRVFVGTEAPGLSALEEAMTILELNKAKSMIVIVLNTLDDSEVDNPIVLGKPTSPAAFAFLLSRKTAPNCLNLKLSLEGTFNPTKVQDLVEESYFVDIVRDLAKQGSFEVPLTLPHFQGSISGKKDK